MSNKQGAANEIFSDLFNKVITAATDMDNYLSHVISTHSLEKGDIQEVFEMVKTKGYTGNLLK